MNDIRAIEVQPGTDLDQYASLRVAAKAEGVADYLERTEGGSADSDIEQALRRARDLPPPEDLRRDWGTAQPPEAGHPPYRQTLNELLVALIAQRTRQALHATSVHSSGIYSGEIRTLAEAARDIARAGLGSLYVPEEEGE